MAEEKEKRTLPDYPFLVDRPAPVRDFVLGERRLIGPKGKMLKRKPLSREGGEEAPEVQPKAKKKVNGGILGDFKPMERIRQWREGDEQEGGNGTE